MCTVIPASPLTSWARQAPSTLRNGPITGTWATSSNYKVYIDTPEKVEVYLDGNYVGISPLNFAKKPGTHTITLRKSGYITRSYTIEIGSEEKDVTYSFADLLESDPATKKTTEEESRDTDTGNEAEETTE